jgi:hypothetical protein
MTAFDSPARVEDATGVSSAPHTIRAIKNKIKKTAPRALPKPSIMEPLRDVNPMINEITVAAKKIRAQFRISSLFEVSVILSADRPQPIKHNIDPLRQICPKKFSVPNRRTKPARFGAPE